MLYFWQGLLLGLAYVAPIGIQNLFVINTALAQPLRRGLGTALIVAFFDISLAMACFFGVGCLLQQWEGMRQALMLLGGVTIVYIGIGLWRAKAEGESLVETNSASSQPFSWSATAVTAAAVTWLNPQAIIDGTMLLGAFRASLALSGLIPFIVGTSLASLGWFSILSGLVCHFKRCFSPLLLLIINRLCGLIIIGCGCKILWQLF